ncbi:MAG: hypothetical protein BGN96_05255 [Bacteroidales bacterium 45-6]|nr:MAG: hypothetical protein BGN96_05255 [Bacteroidales bacterium 45-6]
MTDEQEKLLTEFQVRIRQLMLFCDRLKSDNAKLSALLEEKDAEVKTLKEEVELLGIKYENLKMARALSSQDGQGAEKAKARLAKLVRDVDKCIAMLKN